MKQIKLDMSILKKPTMSIAIKAYEYYSDNTYRSFIIALAVLATGVASDLEILANLNSLKLARDEAVMRFLNVEDKLDPSFIVEFKEMIELCDAYMMIERLDGVW